MRKSKALFRVLDEDTYLYSFPFPSPENGGGVLIKKVRTNVLNILDIRTNVLYTITMIVQQESKMQEDKQNKPTLSLLLAIKDIQPYEANSYSEVVKESGNVVTIRRVYFYNEEWSRTFIVHRVLIPESEYVPDRTTPIPFSETLEMMSDSIGETSQNSSR